MEVTSILLVNRSETVFCAGVQPKDYGLLVELAIFMPNSPAKFDLYVAPIKEGNKPVGTFSFEGRQKGWQQSVIDCPLKKEE